MEARWKRHGVRPSVAIKTHWSACVTFLALSLLHCYMLSMVPAFCSNKGIEPSFSAPWIYASTVINRYNNIREMEVQHFHFFCLCLRSEFLHAYLRLSAHSPKVF